MQKPDWTKIFDQLKINTDTLIADVITIVLVLIAAKIALAIHNRIMSRAIDRTQNISDSNRSKEVVTSLTLIKSFGRYLIYFLALSIIINQLGFGSTLSNLVTVAGVGTLIVSFGAQSIIKDVFAGAFVLFEKQYEVGDYVRINDYEGTITSLAVRSTHLLTQQGQKIIIPNGQINTVINYSGPFNTAVINIAVPYNTDTDRVFSILAEITKDYYETHKELCYEEPVVSGINTLDNNVMTFSVSQKAVGRNHHTVRRDLQVLIKQRFDKEGIAISYPQINTQDS